MSKRRCAAIGLAREIFPRLSFDLIYARPGQTPEAWAARARTGDRPRRRPSVALPADHRGRHAVSCACMRRGNLVMPDADAAADLYALTQEVTARAGLAGLRDFEPRQAGRRKPPQSDLLALRRICRRRPRRAWPLRRERPRASSPSPRRCRRPGSHLVEAKGPRHHRRRDADAIGGDRRIPADGPAASPKASTSPAMRTLPAGRCRQSG